MTTILAAIAIGTTIAQQPPMVRYSGVWEVDSGDAGTLILDLDGSKIIGNLKNPGKDPSKPTRGTANMTGTYTGHRFTVTISYSSGLKADFQGNIDVDEKGVRMDGLRYMGDKPDVKMRLIVSAKQTN